MLFDPYGNGFVVISPKERGSREQSVCLNDQRKEEGEFFVLCKDSCPIWMDFEVRIFPYERPDNSDGVGTVVKNGHADFWVGSINIVDFFACDPRHVKESPSFFSILVDDIPEFGIELFLKCIVEGGERKQSIQGFLLLRASSTLPSWGPKGARQKPTEFTKEKREHKARSFHTFSCMLYRYGSAIDKKDTFPPYTSQTNTSHRSQLSGRRPLRKHVTYADANTPQPFPGSSHKKTCSYYAMLSYCEFDRSSCHCFFS